MNQTSLPFYDPSYLPPGAVRVHVWWIGHGVPRLYDAARVWNGRARQWVWYHQIDGEFYELPPRRDKAQWDEQPLCWRPMNDEWTWPGGRVPPHLPPHQVPRQSTEKQSFGAVEDAEGSDLGREMEGWRDDARRGRQAPDAGEDIYRRWWRDLTQIRYEPKGEVTLKMCEGRVMRAMAAAQAGNLMAQVAGVTAGFLALLVSENSSETPVDDIDAVTRFRQLPPDQTDFPIAMAWVTAISPPETWTADRQAWSLTRTQRVLNWRAKNIPLSFAEIGGKWKPAVSWQAAKQTYDRAIEQCHRAANGRPVHRNIKVRDRMQEVRDGNRQFHNQR